jgi:hypothetical protein
MFVVIVVYITDHVKSFYVVFFFLIMVTNHLVTYNDDCFHYHLTSELR